MFNVTVIHNGESGSGSKAFARNGTPSGKQEGWDVDLVCAGGGTFTQGTPALVSVNARVTTAAGHYNVNWTKIVTLN